MLKNLLKFIFIFTSLSVVAYGAKRPIEWSGNLYKIIHKYNAINQTFFNQVCKRGTEKKYFDLLKNYRGQGYYLPKINGDVDRSAITANLSLYKKKIKYLKKLNKRVQNLKNWPAYDHLEDELLLIIDELLALKKKFHQELVHVKKVNIEKESILLMAKLKKQYNIFIENLFFLKSFNYPNDYLSYRRDYEKYKNAPGLSNKKMANKTFFYRKLVEDGAFDPNHTRSDKYLRTTFDTIYLNLQKSANFIPENVRYDISWALKVAKKNVARGHAVQKKRTKEWLERTQKGYSFYRELIKTTNIQKTKFLVKKQAEATDLLKNYVYDQEARVYEFWAKQPELYKFLFSLETILVNEVGVIDGKYGLERFHVAEVVYNRFYDDYYNQLEPEQMLFSKIDSSIDKAQEKWLNTLFKVGEFSFTYHYIPAVSKIFCPDMSRRGKTVRNKNLKIILKSVKQYDGSFKAFRYFSRISMLGKIDMSSVWTGYSRLPEMAGYKAQNQRKLLRYYLADDYQYLYSFMDKREREHTVVKIGKRTYSYHFERGKVVFNDYRNPHLFAYFKKK